MPRPRRRRHIQGNPTVFYFKPQGIPLRKLQEITLTKEEFEALRLKNLEKLDQNQAALEMKTSQSTFQRILNSAYQKISLAIIKGKAIKIEKE
jgi:predicted DNA-binding protein (UPF0251 family)